MKRRSSKDSQLAYQGLELRQLMAADLFSWNHAVSGVSLDELKGVAGEKVESIEPTHFFQANGETVGMVVLSDRIAVNRTSTVLTRNAAEAVARFELSESRELEGGYSVFTSSSPITDEFVAALRESGWADSVVPVFGMVESKSEAVLLNEVIVALPNDVSPTIFFSDHRFQSYRRLDGTPDQFVATLNGVFGPQALHEINTLAGDPRVAWVSPNFHQAWQKFFTPNDPRFGNLWHLHNTGQGGGLVDADSNLPEAWDVLPGGLNSVVLGIVDDGVSTDHPDLLNWVNVGETPGDGIDNDGNGWIDDINGWNFVTGNNVSIPDTSTDRHGTSVAGVAASRGNNSIGVAGPAYNSRVMSARIFRGSGVASDANIAAAVYYVSGRTQNGTGTWSASTIANHSWGGGAASTAITSAFTWGTTNGRGGLGVPHLVATGNGFGAVSFPANLSPTNPGLIAVGAMNNFGEKSNYSNFGSQVDIVTGSNDTRAGFLAIDTTDRIGAPGYATGDYTGTGSTGFGGTSSATPLATGIGALTLAQAQQLGVTVTAAQLKSLMRNNTKLAGPTLYNLTTGRNDLMGFGLSDASTLLQGIGNAKISLIRENAVIANGGLINVAATALGASRDLVFRVRNQGTSVLNLGTLTSSNPEFQILPPASTALALGQATLMTVRFTPTASGLRSANLTINSNDAGTPAFALQVQGNAFEPVLSGRSFEDRNGDGIYQTGETTLAGRNVFLDQNGNSIRDVITTNFSNNTVANIVDNQTTVSTVSVSGMPGSVLDINVTVNATHTYVGDLELFLVSPGGSRITLMSRRGGSGNNLVNTVFDDQAANAISSGATPFTGSFRPEQLLSTYNGLNPNGTWTLEVADRDTNDVGTLNNWTLAVNSGERQTTTNASGNYSFDVLADGTYTAMSVLPSGWTASGANQHVINVSGTSVFSNRNFGSGFNNRAYVNVFNDLDGDGTVDNGEAGLTGRTFYRDSNSNGSLDNGEPSVNVSADGWASFDLANGAHAIRLSSLAGWSNTVPTDGLRTVNATGAPIYNQTYGSRTVPSTTLVSRNVFYKGGTIAGAPASLFPTNKVVAKQGPTAQTLNFTNVINHTRGINAMVFDYDGLPGGALSNSDFVFQWSPQGGFDATLPANQPANWEAAPNPTLITNNLLGGTTRRIQLEWADRAIVDRWIRVTVNANANTGLGAAEIFYLGHKDGEINGAITNIGGTQPFGRFTVTNLGDVTPVRVALGQNGLNSDDANDVNRSGNINNLGDVVPVRSAINSQLTVIQMPSNPAPFFGGLVSDGRANGSSTGLIFGGPDFGNRDKSDNVEKSPPSSPQVVDRVFSDYDSQLIGSSIDFELEQGDFNYKKARKSAGSYSINDRIGISVKI